MKSMSRLAVLGLLLAVSGGAFATNYPPPKNDPPAVKATADADATAIAGAYAQGGKGGKGGNASADSLNLNVNKAEGGNASQGQSQGQGQGQGQDQGQSQSANNEGNELSVNSTYERSAPSVGQGSFAINGCAAAGNAGGSNTHGSAFLGFGFTTRECYAFTLAQAYQAVGQQKAACDVLNSTKAAKRAEKRGVKLPTCEPVAPRIFIIPGNSDAPVAAPAPDLITRAELAEHEKRIVQNLLSK